MLEADPSDQVHPEARARGGPNLAPLAPLTLQSTAGYLLRRSSSRTRSSSRVCPGVAAREANSPTGAAPTRSEPRPGLSRTNPSRERLPQPRNMTTCAACFGHGQPLTIDIRRALRRAAASSAASPEGKPGALWKLIRDAGGVVSLAGVDTVELERMPMPALSPEYLVVSYTGATVISAVPLAFPSRALALVRAEDSGLIHDSVALTTSSATVFVESDPAIDRRAGRGSGKPPGDGAEPGA